MFYPVREYRRYLIRRYAGVVKTSRLLIGSPFYQRARRVKRLDHALPRPYMRASFPGRLTVRLQTLTLSIEVQILTGEPGTLAIEAFLGSPVFQPLSDASRYNKAVQSRLALRQLVMGIYLKHTQIDRQTGRLSYRRAFPSELRPYLPKRLSELKRSLGATSLANPIAATRYADAQAEYARLEAQARSKLAGKTRALTEADIPSLVETYAHWMETNLLATHFDLDDAKREWLMASAWRFMPYGFWDEQTAIAQGTPRPATAAARLRTLIPSMIDGWRQAIADGDLAQIIEIEGQTAEDLVLEAELEIERSNPLVGTLCVSLLSRDILIAKALLAQVTDGTFIKPTPRPQKTAERFTATALAQIETMQQLAERLLTSRTDPISGPTRTAWATSLKLWQQAHEDVPHDKIKRAMVTDWLELLAQRPTRVPWKERDTPLSALIERYADAENLRRQSGATVSRHLTSLSTIWNMAQRKGYIDALANPFANHAVKFVKSKGGNPLTPAELHAVLALPVFTGNERPRGCKGEAAYWIPLMLLYTGARPGEVAQLLVNDFWETDSGVWFMRYTDEGDHPILGQRKLKTTRSATGKREFQVPKALIDLGLLRYLSWLRANDETALFPQLTLTTKGLYNGWGRWWGNYVRRSGSLPKDKRQAREFRHGFPTAARASGLSEDAIGYLLGHASPNATTAGYGDHSARGLEMSKVDFKGLDISGVKVWKPPK